MPYLGRPVYAEVDLKSLEENIKAIKDVAGSKSIIAVVKDDAYGHGAEKVVKTIEKYCDFFGVACINEALKLKKISSKPFIVFGGVFNGELKYLNEFVIPTVYDFELLHTILTSNKRCRINIEIDTGMGRTGFQLNEVELLISKLLSSKKVELFGLMTHFASSDSDAEYTMKQIAKFKKVYDKFIEARIFPKIVHVANSGGIFYKTESYINAVRPGIMLYGGYPSKHLKNKIRLSPVMSFKSQIISLKKVKKGTPISYGCTFITKRETLVATVACGYGDGYPRSLSNKGIVYIDKKGIAPVIGRVCMDMTMIDVTDISDVKKGDMVTLWGKGDENILPDKIAELAGTISYELFCRITNRTKRIYKHKR